MTSTLSPAVFGVVQFKTALLQKLEDNNMVSLNRRDVEEINSYCKRYYTHYIQDILNAADMSQSCPRYVNSIHPSIITFEGII